MKHKAIPALEIFIETDPTGIVELDSEIGYVEMIPFKGSVNSAIFTGIVEPCGVDTQITNQNEVRHMSARYMLTGKDQVGQNCHIYIPAPKVCTFQDILDYGDGLRVPFRSKNQTHFMIVSFRDCFPKKGTKKEGPLSPDRENGPCKLLLHHHPGLLRGGGAE